MPFRASHEVTEGPQARQEYKDGNPLGLSYSLGRRRIGSRHLPRMRALRSWCSPATRSKTAYIIYIEYYYGKLL